MVLDRWIPRWRAWAYFSSCRFGGALTLAATMVTLGVTGGAKLVIPAENTTRSRRLALIFRMCQVGGMRRFSPSLGSRIIPALSGEGLFSRRASGRRISQNFSPPVRCFAGGPDRSRRRRGERRREVRCTFFLTAGFSKVRVQTRVREIRGDGFFLPAVRGV